MTTPYYQDELVTLFLGDCLQAEAWLEADVLVSDVPYGIAYRSGSIRREGNARSIAGDADTSVRDAALERWGDRPALVFGTWKTAAPTGTNAVLVWDQAGALGMGDLALPWKPSWQMVYVLGRDWAGSRDCGSVLRFPPVQSLNRNHPHEKPVALMADLLRKCRPGVVADPFAGSGSTLVAAKQEGRRAIGVEIDEAHAEKAARRCAAVLAMPAADEPEQLTLAASGPVGVQE